MKVWRIERIWLYRYNNRVKTIRSLNVQRVHLPKTIKLRMKIAWRELFRERNSARTKTWKMVRERQPEKKKVATTSGQYELYVIRFLQRRDVQHPAITLPTCCPRYPPGSTLLECRFEGDQPVAHIVQIPGDRCTATQKINLLVETKATKFGPSAR